MEVEEKKIEVGYGKLALINHDDSIVAGAILEIEKGKKTDMVFHRLGNKLVYVLVGKLKVHVLKNGTLNTLGVNVGSSFYIKPGLIYQFEALEKSVVVEFAENIKVYGEDVYCVIKAPIVKVKSDDAPKIITENNTTRVVGNIREDRNIEEIGTKPVTKRKLAKKNKRTN